MDLDKLVMFFFQNTYKGDIFCHGGSIWVITVKEPRAVNVQLVSVAIHYQIKYIFPKTVNCKYISVNLSNFIRISSRHESFLQTKRNTLQLSILHSIVNCVSVCQSTTDLRVFKQNHTANQGYLMLTGCLIE